MTDWVYQPAYRQVEALNNGRVTSLALLKAHVERFRSLNKRFNLVIKTDIERAEERARALDRMRSDGRVLGPLHGLPMTVKDTLDVDSMPATAGAPEFASRSKPVENAVVVERAKAAGAVIWGKTNVPYLAGDWQSDNRVFGLSANPFDKEKTPGGSSGGAAGALAAGFTPLEIGSDIGGSLRIPAHFCGVTSLKPSFGVIPQEGHVPPSPEYGATVDLNVVGPMARCVRDLKLLRSVIMAGSTLGQSSPTLSVKGLKLAVWTEPEAWPISHVVKGAVEAAGEELLSSGAEVTSAKPDIDPEELIDVYLSLLIPIVAMDAPDRQRQIARLLRPIHRWLQGFSKTPFTLNNWAVKASQSHVEWLAAHGRRVAMREIMRQFFGQYDALIMPVSPTPAFEHLPKGTVISRKLDVDGDMVPYASHLLWIALATACHLPVVTIPIARTDEGLPVGMQIIGPLGQDARLLDLAESIESVLGGFRKPAI